MNEQRKGERIRHSAFEDFKVTLTIKQDSFIGFPGDISESGMSLIVPGSTELSLPIGTLAYISIENSHLKKPFETSVHIVREEEIVLSGKPNRLIGLSFPPNTELPDQIIAIDMMIHE